ncbi:hypothetical protein ACO0K1_08265 [Undibacterium sp. SXout20W]
MSEKIEAMKGYSSHIQGKTHPCHSLYMGMIKAITMKQIEAIKILTIMLIAIKLLHVF